MLNYKKLFIDQNFSIRNAMNKLSETAEKILLVVDKNQSLLGTVTDGDIRRWILKEGNLNEPVAMVMKKNPIFVLKEDGLKKIKELMLTYKIECVPQLDSDKRIIAFYAFEDVLSDSDIRAARGRIEAPVVIMAGGKGDRLKPFTDILPKPLIPAGERPIIEKIMQIFHDFGTRDFFVTLNYKAEMIKAYFAEHSLPYRINFVMEEKFLGTAGSMRLLKEKIFSTFFVTNCDIVVKTNYIDLLNFHKSEKNTMTIVSSMKNFKIPYGVIYHEDNGMFKNMREKPELDFLVNTGIYVFEPEVLKIIPDKTNYDMNQFVEDLQKKRKKIGIYPVSDKSWLDLGQWEEYLASLKFMNES
jgi:dTDP-glucose pyrophosphorylase